MRTAVGWPSRSRPASTAPSSPRRPSLPAATSRRGNGRQPQPCDRRTEETRSGSRSSSASGTESFETGEFDNPDYLKNAPIAAISARRSSTRSSNGLARLGVDVIVNGANLDDRGDYRPGMQAAREHVVRSPLIEAGLTKAAVRALAQHWDAAGVGQARHPLPFQPHRLRRGSDSRANRPRGRGRAVPSPRIRPARVSRAPRSERPRPDRSARGRVADS